jgi:hypothetical protein
MKLSAGSPTDLNKLRKRNTFLKSETRETNIKSKMTQLTNKQITSAEMWERIRVQCKRETPLKPMEMKNFENDHVSLHAYIDLELASGKPVMLTTRCYDEARSVCMHYFCSVTEARSGLISIIVKKKRKSVLNPRTPFEKEPK